MDAFKTTAPVVDPTKHVNYAYGMVLGVDDFTQEFAYHSNRDLWAARDIGGYGTLAGLRVTVGDDESGGFGVNVTAGTAVSSAAKVTINAGAVEVSAGAVTVNAGVAKFSGVVQCDTLISNAVVSSSYTPGAGNIL